MTDKQKAIQEYNKQYARTYKGLSKRIYAHLQRNCKGRGHKLPTFSNIELYKWMEAQPQADILMEAWKESNYDRLKTPSVDRLDNNVNYVFSNMELVSFEENCSRAYEGIRNKTLANSGLLHQHSAVSQFTLHGEFVTSYISMQDAMRKVGVDHRKLSVVCSTIKSVIMSYKGFLWCYKEDTKEFKEMLTDEALKKVRKNQDFKGVSIEKVDKNGNVITTFTSATTAAVDAGVTPHVIRRWVNNQPTRQKSIYTYRRKE